MNNELNKNLLDIFISIESIETYLGIEKNFSVYKSNKMLRRAIEREFEIIGEALNRVQKLNVEITISSQKQIIGLRNIVIHGYDKVDDEIVWGIIIRHLPILKLEVSSYLN